MYVPCHIVLSRPYRLSSPLVGRCHPCIELEGAMLSNPRPDLTDFTLIRRLRRFPAEDFHPEGPALHQSRWLNMIDCTVVAVRFHILGAFLAFLAYGRGPN